MVLCFNFKFHVFLAGTQEREDFLLLALYTAMVLQSWVIAGVLWPIFWIFYIAGRTDDNRGRIQYSSNEWTKGLWQHFFDRGRGRTETFLTQWEASLRRNQLDWGTVSILEQFLGSLRPDQVNPYGRSLEYQWNWKI